MKRKLNNMLSWLLLIVLTGVLLAGCGAKDNNENGEKTNANNDNVSNGSSNNETGSSEKEEPVELIWYLIGSPQEDEASVEAAVNEILLESINATLDMRVLDWGEYDQKMQLKMASGEAFDICFSSLAWVNKYVDGVNKGAFMPLDDLLAEHAPNYYKMIPEKYWEATKINGDIYCAINYQTMASMGGVFMPKKMVDKYNFDYENVKTAKDLEPYLEAIRDNEPGMYPALTKEWITFYYPEGDTPIHDVGGYLAYNTTDYSIKNEFSEEDIFSENVFRFMRDWYLKGYFRKDAASVTEVESDLKIMKYGVWPGTYKPGVEVELSNKYGYEIVAVPMTKPVIQTRSVLSGMNVISRTSKNPEKAMALIEQVNTNKELYNLLAFGIEGKHYQKIDDQTIEKIEGGGYWSGIAWEFGNQFNAYYTKGQKPGIWEETIAMNEAAISSPTLGFMYVPSEEVKAIDATNETIQKEYIAGLTTGTLDPDKYLPILREKLKKNDPDDKLIKEAQEQLDAWLTKNNK